MAPACTWCYVLHYQISVASPSNCVYAGAVSPSHSPPSFHYQLQEYDGEADVEDYGYYTSEEATSGEFEDEEGGGVASGAAPAGAGGPGGGGGRGGGARAARAQQDVDPSVEIGRRLLCAALSL